MLTSTYPRCYRVLRYRHWHAFSKVMTVSFALCLLLFFSSFSFVSYIEREQHSAALHNLRLESGSLYELYSQFGRYLRKNEHGSTLLHASDMIKQFEPYFLVVGVPKESIDYLERHWSSTNWFLLGNNRHLAMVSVNKELCATLPQTPGSVKDLNALVRQLSSEKKGEIFCYHHDARSHADPIMQVVIPSSLLRKVPVAVILLEPGEDVIPVHAVDNGNVRYSDKVI